MFQFVIIVLSFNVALQVEKDVHMVFTCIAFVAIKIQQNWSIEKSVVVMELCHEDVKYYPACRKKRGVGTYTV